MESILSEIDVFFTGDDLISSMNEVYLRYSSSGLTGSAFESSIDGVNGLRSYQAISSKGNPGSATNIRSFDLNYCGKVIGRTPSSLKGDLASRLDTGADDIFISDAGSIYVDDNGSSTSAGPATISYDRANSNGQYNDENIFASLIPRVLVEDEGLLRISVKSSDYINLNKLTLGGGQLLSGFGNVNNKIHSNQTSVGHSVSLSSALSVVYDENPMHLRAVGHEFLLLIANEDPPELGNNVCAKNASNTANLPWKIVERDGQDLLALTGVQNLSKIPTLQTVMKTRLSIINRDGSQLNTGIKKCIINLIFS